MAPPTPRITITEADEEAQETERPSEEEALPPDVAGEAATDQIAPEKDDLGVPQESEIMPAFLRESEGGGARKGG